MSGLLTLIRVIASPGARQGRLEAEGLSLKCALGKGGPVPDKQEGDGGTPLGDWPLRKLHYRADKGGAPLTALPSLAIDRLDGWCDDPADPAYNRPVRLPYPASHETMWREDGLYDLVVELGYNDDPVVPGKGSAIFLHIARPDYAPTEGCVALAEPDLRRLLARCGVQTILRVELI
ncbi:L,D-transpeptidase family protein [Oceanibaculum indicum]|uniref:L,D-peptidoglycan transpeptidase YkuD (ErfK/YbiS/YcfS/YnhG family) n=1 Tax=Oceanibaculum indicum TaxID=526216 RepID=A0A420WC51_9PROT|nr:L,D-transpeptidase family protein [Oceanibaculum indicum]RKQ68609.1 L,D-peptidoglycan transpeptidase YkuD (ErfK/YbiS/YcfS/YnhG family) [Oceanibaculum indicum]